MCTIVWSETLWFVSSPTSQFYYFSFFIFTFYFEWGLNFYFVVMTSCHTALDPLIWYFANEVFECWTHFIVSADLLQSYVVVNVFPFF